jgi:hypothetical protein
MFLQFCSIFLLCIPIVWNYVNKKETLMGHKCIYYLSVKTAKKAETRGRGYIINMWSLNVYLVSYIIWFVAAIS